MKAEATENPEGNDSAAAAEDRTPRLHQAAPHRLVRRRSGMAATQKLIATPDPKNRPLLVRTDSTDAGKVLHLSERCYTIGRHPDNTACITDDGISRFHARVTVIGNRYWLEDLGSSNGTFVNGQKINATELRNGDTLQCGANVHFRFTVASDDEEQSLRRLYDSSIRDPLTQAFNRRYFAAHATSEVAFAVRHDAPLSLLLLDIDHFKQINDTHGHPVGDQVLRHLSATLSGQLRTEDLFARYGGEEFVILMRSTPLETAYLVAERLLSQVRAMQVPKGTGVLSITVSIGCASLTCGPEQSLETLIHIADERLYRAKHQGRNRVVAQ